MDVFISHGIFNYDGKLTGGQGIHVVFIHLSQVLNTHFDLLKYHAQSEL